MPTALKLLQVALIGCSLACTSAGTEPDDPRPAATVSAAPDAQPAGEASSSAREPAAPESQGDPSDPVAPLVVDLTGALELALGESPDLLAAAARVSAARAGLAEARAAYLPTLGVDLSYLRADAPSMYLFKTIDAGNFVPGTDFNDPGTFSNWEAGLQLRYNLYAGGRDELRGEIAARHIESAQLQTAQIENALVAAVIDAWFEVRLGDEQINTARASAETVRAQLEEARARYEEGRSLETDVLSLEVRRAEAVELEIRARNGRDLALATLAQLLGVGSNSSLQLDGAGSVPGIVPSNRDEALARALAERPALALSRAATRVARSSLGIAESAMLPEADLYARAWRDAPEFDSSSRDNWALGVSVHWGLFNGGRGPAADRSRALLDVSRRTERKIELAIELDVQDAWLRLESARSRTTVADAAVNAAAETLRQVQVQYEAGAATVTRYLEAELMNTEAHLRLIRARYDLERAKANLLRAVGGFATSDGGTAEQ